MNALLSSGQFSGWIGRLSVWKKIRLVWFTLVILFMGWLIASYRVRGVDASVMTSNQQVSVQHSEEAITFSPVNNPHPLTFIFYPGALVAAKSYAPFARAIAQQGYTTIVVKMPFRLASLGHEKALQIIRKDKGTHQWVLGGHSLGAAKAAQFAYENPSLLQGLILIGTSHPRKLDLFRLQLDVTKVYASRDGLASVEEVMEFKHNLPATTHFVEIPGGNHAQFGYYGDCQLSDHAASISREVQQQLTIEATVQALQKIRKTAEYK